MEKKTNNLWSALSKFQEECPKIGKGANGYGYKYADLPSIMEVINPILAKHKLVISQPLDGRAIMTKLVHIPTGEIEFSRIEIPEGVSLKGMNQFQVDGSAITYYRRYALSSLLAIVTDDDTDASGKQIKSEPREIEATKKQVIKVGTKMFDYCVERYGEGISRMDMSDHVTISDKVWKDIVKASNSKNL